MSFLVKTILRGEKFRPVFKNIGEMICMFEDAMHLLLSAIATVTLSKVMNLKAPVVVTENVDRPNIFLEIRN